LAQFYVPWIIIILISLAVNHPKVHWIDSLSDMKWMMLIPLVAWTASVIDFKSKFVLKNIRYFYIPILIVSIYAVLITVLGFDPMRPNRIDLVMISKKGGIRTPGFLGNPMTFAHAYGVLFCILWAHGLYLFGELKTQPKTQLKKIDLYALAFTILISAIAIFLSVTRGAWLSIGIGITTITFLYKPKWGKLVILGALISLILAFLFVPTVRDRILEAVHAGEAQGDRINLWKANIQMFLDHPFTGVGYGENVHLLDDYFEKMNLPANSFKSHAHNQFLQQLGGTGIFGLFVYLGFLFVLAKNALRSWQSFKNQDTLWKALSLGLFAAVIHILIGGLFEANFEDSETLHMFCFFVGLFLYYQRDTLITRTNQS
jgi:O-antigen ligase